MLDKELENKRAIQFKEEEIANLRREQANLETSTFEFYQSLKKSQQQLEESKRMFDKTNNFETIRDYDNDIALLWQISSKVQSLGDEMQEEINDKKRRLLGELEDLEAANTSEEGSDGQ